MARSPVTCNGGRPVPHHGQDRPGPGRTRHPRPSARATGRPLRLPTAETPGERPHECPTTARAAPAQVEPVTHGRAPAPPAAPPFLTAEPPGARPHGCPPTARTARPQTSPRPRPQVSARRSFCRKRPSTMRLAARTCTYVVLEYVLVLMKSWVFSEPKPVKSWVFSEPNRNEIVGFQRAKLP